MNKFFALLLALVMAFSFTANAESMLCGGWNVTTDATVTEEAQKALETALNGLIGCVYEPVALLGTQVVAGMNYCLLCRLTPIVPNPMPDYALVIVYADLNGGATITDVAPINMLIGSEGTLDGGWNVTTDATVTEEAQNALTTARRNAVGVKNEPVALLSTQVVAGINYCLLSRLTVNHPDATPYYALVVVYAGLNGDAKVVEITPIDIAEFISFTGEEDLCEDNPVMNLIGSYFDSNSQRAHMTIECEGMDSAAVDIIWSDSAFQSYEWRFSGVYDTEANVINYDNCVCSLLTYTAEDECTAETIYENGTGSLEITEDWNILWHDDVQNAGELCVFEFYNNPFNTAE